MLVYWVISQREFSEKEKKNNNCEKEHTTRGPDLDVVGDWQIHEQTFIIDKSASGHLLQTVNRAIGQVGVGCENTLLDHVKRTVVRLLSAQ